MSNEHQMTDLLRSFHDVLTRYVVRRVRDPHLAQDIVQEVFVRYHSHRDEIDEPRLRAWMYRVARNLVIDHVRRASHSSELESPDQVIGEPSRYDPSLVAQQKELSEMLLETLNELPARQKEVVRLKFQEGLTYAEIADVTGQTRSTVGWLLHQAITLLRIRMKGTDK